MAHRPETEFCKGSLVLMMKALVKNTIAKLNTINARVVFMDIAKQDTIKGLPYALFRNFLRSLELPGK